MPRIQRSLRHASLIFGIALAFAISVGAVPQQRGRDLASPDLSAQRVAGRDSVPAQAVPRLVKFGGTLRDGNGTARTGAVGVAFAIYADQTGGAPLWMESQNVALDEAGKYSALLGAATRDGVPLDLFSSGEPRWLGVQVQLPDEVEQPRVLLVSVPYALKASDADTLGGKPATDYLLRSQLGPTLASDPSLASSAGLTRAPVTGGQVVDCTTNCATNTLAKFSSATTLTASLLSDNGTRITASGGIDFGSDFSFINNAAPASTGRVQMFDKAFVGFVIRGLNILFETLQPAPVEALRIDSTGNVGIGTAAPTARLHVAGGNIRTNGVVRVGSEAGTFEPPDGAGSVGGGALQNPGLVVRRIISTFATNGAVVAGTDAVTFVRDGSFGGFRAIVAAVTDTQQVACIGTTVTGTIVTSVFEAPPNSATTVYTNSQNVVYMQCSFGNMFSAGHTAQITLHRQNGDLYWVGTLISTFNQ